MPNYRTASAAGAVDERMLDLDRSVVGLLLARLGALLARVAARLGRLMWRHPLDSLAAVTAGTASLAILANALFLQASPHPAPILAGKPRPVSVGDATGSFAAPPHAPARSAERTAHAPDAAPVGRSRAQIVSDIQRELARRGFFEGPVDGVYGARTDTAIRDFEQAVGMKAGAQPDEALLAAIARSPVRPASKPVAVAARPAGPHAVPVKPAAQPKRIIAVQRALADFGYGQMKPSGVMGADTKAAIERFERERRLPVTGQISDRLTRELAAVTGRPLE